MKSSKTLLLILVALIGAVAGGRLYARHLAADYGRRVSEALMPAGNSRFVNSFQVRQLFVKASMSGTSDVISQLSFLGGHYEDCLKELRAGMLYLSEQAGEPAAKRFKNPPSFQHLKWDLADHSDQGVAAAAAHLIESYMAQL